MNDVRKAAARRIAVQYLGNGVEEYAKPWMDYLKDQTTPVPGSQNTVNTIREMTRDHEKENREKREKDKEEEQFKVVKPDSRGGDPEFGPSLINNVPDALSLKKQQESPPANENDSYRSDPDQMHFPISINKFDRKDVPDTSLYWWWRSRNRQDEATGSPWGSNLFGDQVDVGTREALDKSIRVKLAYKNLHEIIESSSHPKTEETKEKGKELTPRDVSTPEGKKTGRYDFKVPGENGEYDVKLQFLKDEGDAENLIDHPVNIACSCDGFLYWGPQYYAARGNYMYLPMLRPQLTEPSETKGGRGKGLTFCKHIYAVASHLMDLGVDPDYNEDVEEDLLEIQDDIPTDPQEAKEDLHVDKYQNFITYINQGKHDRVYETAIDQLKEQGISEHSFSDYVSNRFATFSEEKQKSLIEDLSDTPDTIILLLLEYRKEIGRVPDYLLETAYEAINDVIGG